MLCIDTDRRDVGPYKVILRTEYKPFQQINTEIIRSEATLNFAFCILHSAFKIPPAIALQYHRQVHLNLVAPFRGDVGRADRGVSELRIPN